MWLINCSQKFSQSYDRCATSVVKQCFLLLHIFVLNMLNYHEMKIVFPCIFEQLATQYFQGCVDLPGWDEVG